MQYTTPESRAAKFATSSGLSGGSTSPRIHQDHTASGAGTTPLTSVTLVA